MEIKHNLKVIYILWLRQVKRHFRSKARVFSSIGQPILFLIALGFGFESMYAQAGYGDYIQFLVPGIIGMSIIFSSMFSGMEVISDKQFGFLKETLVSPVSRLTIMAGRTLGGATVAIFQGVLVLLISFMVGFRPESLGSLALTFLFMFLISLLFTSIGTSFASLFNDMHAFPVIINFVIMPLFFLSGALFPTKDLSPIMDSIIKINPLSYGIDGIRGSLIEQFNFGIFTDLTVLIICTMIFLVIGSYLFRRIEI